MMQYFCDLRCHELNRVKMYVVGIWISAKGSNYVFEPESFGPEANGQKLYFQFQKRKNETNLKGER